MSPGRSPGPLLQGRAGQYKGPGSCFGQAREELAGPLQQLPTLLQAGWMDEWR